MSRTTIINSIQNNKTITEESGTRSEGPRVDVVKPTP